MDIYQLAKEMELEGKRYYLKLRQETEDVQIKRVFEILADEEEGHFQLFDAMQRKVETPVINSNFVDAEAIFKTYFLESVDLRSSGSVLEAYDRAVKLEDNSIAYYKKMSKIAETPAEKALFLKLFFEEKKHKFLLENMMELLRDTEESTGSAEITKSFSSEDTL